MVPIFSSLMQIFKVFCQLIIIMLAAEKDDFSVDPSSGNVHSNKIKTGRFELNLSFYLY